MRQVPCSLVVLKNGDACRIKTRRKKLHTYSKKTTYLMVSASATYSASVVESVTHF